MGDVCQKALTRVRNPDSFLRLDCLPNSSGKSRILSPNSSIGQAIRWQQKASIESLILFVHQLLYAGKQTSEVFDLLLPSSISLSPKNDDGHFVNL